MLFISRAFHYVLKSGVNQGKIEYLDLYVESEYSGYADALYKKDSDWIVPFLWRSEFRNVLAALTRKGTIHIEHAYHLYYEALQLLAGKEYRPDSMEVLRLAAEIGCSAYDCEFVQLAQYYASNLITMDKKLLSVFPQYTRKLTEYVH